MELHIRRRREGGPGDRVDRVTVRAETSAATPTMPAGKGFVSSCYAPFTSLYFDQFGKARACCQNTSFPLGDVRHQSIREIWEGEAAERLRSALRADDFSLGCRYCDWQAHERDPATSFPRVFDIHPAPTPKPRWPVQMEFSLTNACNLQCTMCSGEFSSAIRLHREKLPPMPTAYGDAFFEELADFLPHLQKVNFLGGEPFLGKEPLRVLDMMADMGLDTEVAITTNGTQWSPRIERICERLNVAFVLSLDGITKSTYESIRIGADFDEVMANLDRFQAFSKEPTTSIAHCLMTYNWWEFADLLHFAEDRGLGCYVNVVNWPAEASLYRLKPSQLAEVVEGLERLDETTAAGLTTLRPVWEAELSALQRRLRVLQNNPLARGVVAQEFYEPSKDTRSEEEWLAILGEWGDGPIWTIACDADEVVRSIAPSPATVLGVDLSSRVGQPLNTVLGLLQDRLGPSTARPAEMVGGAVDTSIVFDRPGEPIEVRAVIVSLLNSDGDPNGKVLYVARRPVETGPVSLAQAR